VLISLRRGFPSAGRATLPYLDPFECAVIRVCDADFPNPRLARAMQDGVRLALLHFLQQLTGFQRGRRNDLDTAPFGLRSDFVHYRKRAMCAGSNNEPLASPRNF